MMKTFISSTGTCHLVDASRGVTACGRKYFTPEASSAYNLITCRVCEAHLRNCHVCQKSLKEQQVREGKMRHE